MKTVIELSGEMSAVAFLRFAKQFKKWMLNNGEVYYRVYKKDFLSATNKNKTTVEYKYWKEYNDCIWIDKINNVI